MGPLSGYQVVEMASIGPIPMCGMLLADMGADVIRIDRMTEKELGTRRDPRFEITGRGKRSLAVDLKTADGKATVMALLEQSDVLIEGYRPGVMERLGLGPEDCLRLNPRLVYGRLTGWGQDGPLSQAAGHDMNFIALAGALHAIGSADGPPVPPLNLVGDLAGGSLFLAFGIACALLEREKSGLGQVIDSAIIDGVSSLLASVHGQASAGTWQANRGEHIVGGAAPWNTVYETADGKHISICGIESRFYEVLLDKLHIDAATLPERTHRENWPVLRARFSDIFRSRTRDEWSQLLEGSDCCFAPVLSVTEMRQHPHVQQRAMFCSVDGVEQPAPAPRFSRSHPEIKHPPLVRPGQHSDQVLTDYGFSPAQIKALRSRGAIA